MFEDWVDAPKLKGTWCIENEKLAPKPFTGEFDYKNCQWSGFYKKGNQMSHLVFPVFKVDHTTGQIDGAGTHKLPNGNSVDYSVEG